MLILYQLCVAVPLMCESSGTQLPDTVLQWMTEMTEKVSALESNLKVTQSAVNDTKSALLASRAKTTVLENVLEDTLADLTDTKQVLQDNINRAADLQYDKRDRINTLSDRGTGPECYLGSRYAYEEYVHLYANGDPMLLEINGGGPTECLNQCYITPGCIGVNIETDIHQCLGLSTISGSMVAEGWVHYKLTQPDECMVDDDPVIIFQATVTTDKRYASGAIVIWDMVRINTTGDLGSDGKFRCPVSGIYSFTVDAVPYTTTAVYDPSFDIMHNDVLMRRLNSHHNGYNNFIIPVSGTAYIDCMAGDHVWVQAWDSNSEVEGSYWQSTFSGHLLSMIV